MTEQAERRGGGRRPAGGERGAGRMKQWWSVGFGVVVLALVVWQWPEIERYRRIRAM